jgi:hypothetical protein
MTNNSFNWSQKKPEQTKYMEATEITPTFSMYKYTEIILIRVRDMVFNTTLNNASAIPWRSGFISGGNWSTWRKLHTCRKSLTNIIT